MHDGGEIDRSRRHVPVLLPEVLEALDPQPGDTVLDGTVGFGGHAEAILARLGGEGKLVGIDRDEEALEAARIRLERINAPFVLFRGLFTEIRRALLQAGVDPEGGLDGVLLDLGVSSHQLDTPGRGFSFSRDGPLDMRMAFGEGMAAADWLRDVPVAELARVLREFGEEPAAGRLARAIDARRRQRPILTTRELAEVVESVRRPVRGRIHPATRVFQAIRIVVNDELRLLEAFLESVDRHLAPGGRLVVISYHSLEDRLVKTVIRRRMEEGIFQPRRGGAIRPEEEEVRRNPRARSARLRLAVRRN